MLTLHNDYNDINYMRMLLSLILDLHILTYDELFMGWQSYIRERER